jgi:selenocysteine lyase/cysteine desulfurase
MPGGAALAAACRELTAARGEVEAHERRLLALLVDGLDDIPDITLHRLWPDTETAGIVGFSVARYDCVDVAGYLAAEHGIGVRAMPTGALQVSVGVGSRLDDVDRLLDALWHLVARGPSGVDRIMTLAGIRCWPVQSSPKAYFGWDDGLEH